MPSTDFQHRVHAMGCRSSLCFISLVILAPASNLRIFVRILALSSITRTTASPSITRTSDSIIFTIVKRFATMAFSKLACLPLPSKATYCFPSKIISRVGPAIPATIADANRRFAPPSISSTSVSTPTPALTTVSYPAPIPLKYSCLLTEPRAEPVLLMLKPAVALSSRLFSAALASPNALEWTVIHRLAIVLSFVLLCWPWNLGFGPARGFRLLCSLRIRNMLSTRLVIGLRSEETTVGSRLKAATWSIEIFGRCWKRR